MGNLRRKIREAVQTLRGCLGIVLILAVLNIAGVLLIEYTGMPVWLAVGIVLFGLVVIGIIIEPPPRGF
jgi:hypothetical protein